MLNVSNKTKDECCAIANKAGRKLRETVDSMNDETKDIADNVAKTTENVIKTVRDKPLQATMIAAGVGFLAGLLFRR